MRVRPARIRDTAAIVNLIGDSSINEDQVINLIQEGHVFVAVDFSANVLGCSLAQDKIYVSEHSYEDNVAEGLKKFY